MKNFYKTIIVLLFAGYSIALVSPAFAEPIENVKPSAVEETEQDHEIEFYDYHSGITYSYSLFNFVYRGLVNVTADHENNQRSQ